MLSVELGHLATILDSTGKGQNISALAKQWSSRIHDSIWENTIVDNIFAYETNGEWVCRRLWLFVDNLLRRIWCPVHHG